MYLIEHFCRLQEDGREDTVSVYMPNVAEESVSPEALEASASLMRMAAMFTKQAMVAGKTEDLRHAIRVMNRVMEACERDDRKWPDQI